MKHLAMVILAGLAACGPTQDNATAIPSENLAAESSATVFDLSSSEMSRLESAALGGDAEASFRLSQFYSFAGTGTLSDAANERRWLELATSQGHEVAKLNLAVAIATDDCARAVVLMEDVARNAADTGVRNNASSWLEDARFQCAKA